MNRHIRYLTVSRINHTGCIISEIMRVKYLKYDSYPPQCYQGAEACLILPICHFRKDWQKFSQLGRNDFTQLSTCSASSAKLQSAQEEGETAIINVNPTQLSDHMDHPVLVMREIQNQREQLTDWRIFRMVLQWARSSARRRA